MEIESIDTHSGSDAASLSRCVKNFEFIFCLHVLRKILGLTNVLNVYLQSPKNNYATVKDMAMHTIESLKDYRCDSKLNELWILSKTVCDQNKLDPPKMPRMSKVPNRHGGGAKQAV